MLTINNLKNKMIVAIDGLPYQILEVKHLHMGRGGASVQTKIKNLVTGRVFSRNFKPADTFDQAEVEKRELTCLYAHRDQFVFAVPARSSERYALARGELGQAVRWLKPATPVTALFLSGKLLTITLPIKMDFTVAEAPPGLKGNTVSGVTKTVTIETGAKVEVPLFVEAGDVIRVNTETGEYVERASKA